MKGLVVLLSLLVIAFLNGSLFGTKSPESDHPIPATSNHVEDATIPTDSRASNQAPVLSKTEQSTSRTNSSLSASQSESNQNESSLYKLSVLLLRQAPTPQFKAMLDDILLKDGQVPAEDNYRRLANVVLALQDTDNISGYAILSCMHDRAHAHDLLSKMDLPDSAALCAVTLVAMYGEGVVPEAGRCPARYDLSEGKCLRNKR